MSDLRVRCNGLQRCDVPLSAIVPSVSDVGYVDAWRVVDVVIGHVRVSR